MDPQALQQVGSRSSQSSLAAEGLQQVGHQIEVDIQRLDLLLRLLWACLCGQLVYGGGLSRAVAQVCLVMVLQKV